MEKNGAKIKWEGNLPCIYSSFLNVFYKHANTKKEKHFHFQALLKLSLWCYIHIVGQSMDTTDELSHHSSNIIGLHIEDKEKERVQLRVKHVYF